MLFLYPSIKASYATLLCLLYLPLLSNNCNDSTKVEKFTFKKDNHLLDEKLINDNNKYSIVEEPYEKFLSPDKLTIIGTFDGSKSITMWEDILKFAKKNNIKFTFFVSGVYLLPDNRKHDYKLPYNMQHTGVSEIGFGGTEEYVNTRISYFHRAIKEGHDIQSHLNGHFDGTKWSEETWRNEFDQFSKFMALFPNIKHVRFPLLAQNNNVYKVMADLNYKSIVSPTIGMRKKTVNHISFNHNGKKNTIIEYPIYYYKSEHYNSIIMDYNLYYVDTKRNPKFTPEQIENNVYQLYMKIAKECFEEKVPMFFNHHFSLWEDSAYWKAMQRAIIDIKKMYEVESLTISELTEKIEKVTNNLK